MARDKRPCVHHWRLSAPGSDGTDGECSRCGATRTFSGGVAQGKDALRAKYNKGNVETKSDRALRAEESASAALDDARRAIKR